MTKLQFRHGTTAEWATSNPVLGSGEPGVDITTGDFKIGDGVTRWGSIPLAYAPPSLLTTVPRGVVAVGAVLDPTPAIAAEGVWLTHSLHYTFDPTRRYRVFYSLRAFSGAAAGFNSGTMQFQIWNMVTNLAIGADHITSADVSYYSGCLAEWLITFNGYAELRLRTTTFNSGGGTTAYGREFYIEDVGAYP